MIANETLTCKMLVSAKKSYKTTKKIILDRWKGFKIGCAGLYDVLLNDKNIKIYSMIAIAVITIFTFLRISTVAWLLVLSAVSLVFISEILNTAIENICNLVTRDYNIQIKYIKDISAGAVVLAIFYSVIVGIVVFLHPN